MKYLLILFLMVVATSAYADVSSILVDRQTGRAKVSYFDSNEPVKEVSFSRRDMRLLDAVEDCEAFKLKCKATRYSIFFTQEGSVRMLDFTLESHRGNKGFFNKTFTDFDAQAIKVMLNLKKRCLK